MQRRTKRIVVALGLGFLIVGGVVLGLQSEIVDTDERVVLFTTAARLAEDGKTWHLPIHGWIHEPEDSFVRRGVIAAALQAKFDLEVTEATAPYFDRRVNLFLVDNERGKKIRIRVGDGEIVQPPSGANGHFLGKMVLSVEDAEKIAVDGVVPISVVLPKEDGRTFKGRVLLVPDKGVSVISDIDDTVKISAVIDKKKLIDRTFFREFEAAPGMAALYSTWAKRGVRFHFVSSSPWHLYEPLVEFLKKSGFPTATLILKHFRVKDSTFWDMFKKGTATKPLQIKPILDGYPGRRFVLIGDSGEQDPEVYAKIFREHSDQIVRIYIRNVTGATREDERFKTAFANVPSEKWALFKDPSTLDLPE